MSHASPLGSLTQTLPGEKSSTLHDEDARDGRRDDGPSMRMLSCAVNSGRHRYSSAFGQGAAGCVACKQKRMKCDETQPSCRNCTRRNVSCPGYTRQLKWSTKYERYRPKQSSPENSRTRAGILGLSGDHTRKQTSHCNETEDASPERGQDDLVDTSVPVPDRCQTVATCSKDKINLLDPEQESPISNWMDEIPNFLEPDELQQLNESSALSLSLYSQDFEIGGDEHVETLMKHYFSCACRVMSCFDSPSNPYRTDIPRTLQLSPHIFHCLMSMSAAHMSNFADNMAKCTLTYQAKAMGMLQKEMSRLSASSTDLQLALASTRYSVLLGTIILGMTSAWHDPSAYTLSHLFGARSLFQAWANDQGIIDEDGNAVVLDRSQSFIVGSMAYWECLASFVTDQSLDTIDYLRPFLTVPEGQLIYPNPWTGVSTPAFIFVAQLGILLRQQRVLTKLSQIKRGCPMATEANSGLLQDAQILHDAVLAYTLPPRDLMEETGDASTPVDHLCDVARIYRYVILLEINQAFPSLVKSDGPDTGATETRNNGIVFDLATSALTIIFDLPRSSGTPTILAIAYISAGSALQTVIAESCTAGNDDPIKDLSDELHSIRRSRPAVHWWRANVRQQILHAHRQLGLITVQRSAKLVQEVWNRSDIQAKMASNLRAAVPVHWMDVMIEQRLETLYG